MENQLEAPKDKMSEEFDEILNTLSNFRKSVSQLQTQIKGVEKTVQKKTKEFTEGGRKASFKGK